MRMLAEIECNSFDWGAVLLLPMDRQLVLYNKYISRISMIEQFDYMITLDQTDF